jgi:hypothetical protein
MASDAAPQLELPPDDGPASPAAERVVRAHEVSADLEAIFGQAVQPPVAEARARAQAPTRRVGPREASRRNKLAGVGVVSAAALAGVAIGSLLARVPQFARTPAPAASAPQPEPAHLTSLPVQPLPPLENTQAVDEPLVASPAPTPPKAKPRVVRAHARTARPPRASHACCSYAQVQAADRRLREAYAVAVRKGVPRSEIVTAHNRWSAARRRAARDPVRLIDDYRDITDDLNRASNRTYARSDGGRFQPRYAAWWR